MPLSLVNSRLLGNPQKIDLVNFGGAGVGGPTLAVIVQDIGIDAEAESPQLIEHCDNMVLVSCLLEF